MLWVVFFCVRRFLLFWTFVLWWRQALARVAAKFTVDFRQLTIKLFYLALVEIYGFTAAQFITIHDLPNQ